MKNFIYHFLVSIILFSFFIVLQSCHEKGCTDKNAINYNSVADEDDGSCLTCNNKIDTLSINTYDIEDNNSSSQHAFQYVATVTLKQVRNKYTYSECGNTSCYFLVYLKSLVSQKMILDYRVEVNGNIFFNTNFQSTVDGFQTIFVDTVPSNNISNPCGLMTSSSLFVALNNNIIYQ